MQSERANKILEWESADGSRKSIISVVDESLGKSDLDRHRLELCVFDPEGDKWKTEEALDYVSDITDFGIPQRLVD